MPLCHSGLKILRHFLTRLESLACFSWNKSYLVKPIISSLSHHEGRFGLNDKCYVSMNILWALCSAVLAVLRNACIALHSTDHRFCALIIQTAEHTARRIGAIFKLSEGNRIPSINTAYEIKPPLYPCTLPILHDFSGREGPWKSPSGRPCTALSKCVRLAVLYKHPG